MPDFFNKLLGRFLLGGVLPAFLLVIVAVVAIVAVQDLEDALEWEMHTHRVIAEAAGIKVQVANLRGVLLTYKVLKDRAYQDRYQVGGALLFKSLAVLRDEVQDNPSQVNRLEVIHQRITEWQGMSAGVFQSGEVRPEPTAAEGRLAQAKSILPVLKKVIEINYLIDGFLDEENALLAKRRDRAQALIWNIGWIIGLTTLVSLVVSVGIAYALARQVTLPVEELEHAAGKLVGGEFMPLKSRGPKEIAQLMDHFTRMGQALLDREAKLAAEIGERRRAETALGQKNNLLQAILASMGEGVVVADRQGKFILWNPAGETLIGRGPAAVPPEQWSDYYQVFLPDKSRCPADQLPLVRAIRGEVVDNCELIFRDGKREKWVNTSARPLLDESGALAGGVIVLHDTSERQRNEAAIRELNNYLMQKNLDLLAINKELESFSYSVSHDLRAPLRSIDGFSLALLEDYGPQLDGPAQVYLNRVRTASQRMGMLIDDLLKLARVSRAEFHPEAVDLAALTRLVTAELQERNPGRSVAVVLPGSLPAWGDPRLLRIVLDNLLNNAWKYSAKQARARIEFGATNHDSRPAYFVRDNGAGFDMAFAGRLFGAFQRLHTAHEFEGTGIGLATVQRIIHRHGGQVWAESQVGQGATFYFTLAPSLSGEEAT